MTAVSEMQEAVDLLREATAKLERAAILASHAVAYWSAEARTPPETVLPSQLPDRTLGPALRAVRDFLCRAPGQPVDPEFDRVVAAVGLAEARQRADFLLGAARPTDEIWLALRDMARAGRADMERAE